MSTLSGSLLISGSIIPATDGVSLTSSFDLGSSTAAWKDIYVSNGTINFLDGGGNIVQTMGTGNNQLTGDTFITGRLSQGSNVTASGLFSHAEGSSSIALGTGSHAEGLGTIAAGNFQHVQGRYNATSSTAYAFIIGNGSNNLTRSNLFYVDENKVQIAADTSITSSLRVTSQVAIGTHFVLGVPSPVGILLYGNSNTIGGDAAFSNVGGVSNIVNGVGCHAEGYGNLINLNAVGSHAEGYQTKIHSSGEYCHTEGYETIASGSYTHAEGLSSIARAQGSHAEGVGTLTLGIGSHAEGLETIAAGNYQHVAGQYNATSSVESAFIVGNGDDDSTRSNLIFAAGNTVTINDLVKLQVRTTNPGSPSEGMIMSSGSAGTSKLYYYNGTAWVDLTA